MTKTQTRPCIAPNCILAASDGDVFCDGHGSAYDRGACFEAESELDEIEEYNDLLDEDDDY